MMFGPEALAARGGLAEVEGAGGFGATGGLHLPPETPPVGNNLAGHHTPLIETHPPASSDSFTGHPPPGTGQYSPAPTGGHSVHLVPPGEGELAPAPAGEVSRPHPSPLPNELTETHHVPAVTHISTESGGTGAWNHDLNNPQPNTHYTVDTRFSYNTDDLHRSTDASGSLDFGNPSDRNAYQQGIAGGADRLPGDHGGHIFGAQFGGPGEAINITAMDGTINKSSYAALENEWKSLMQQGYNVDVDVQIEYPDNSMRPSRYVVNTIVDGKLIGTRFFDNYGGGAQ